MKHQLKNTIVLSTSLLLANVLIPTTLAFAEEAPGVNENSSYEILTDDTFVGQSDEDDLGYSYKQMDEVLKLLVDEKKSKEELIKLGFEENLINNLKYRIKANAFKGKLPTIANINWS